MPNFIQQMIVIGLGVLSVIVPVNAAGETSYPATYPVTIPATGHREQVFTPPHELDCRRENGFQVCETRLDQDAVTTPMIYCSVHLPDEASPSQATAVDIQRLVYLGYNAFDTDKAEVKAAEVEHLLAWAKLNKNRDEAILILATTDIRGDELYNRKLAYQRALAVYQYLSTFGIRRIQISIQGRPLRTGDYHDYPPQHSHYRRIELYQGGDSCRSLRQPGAMS
ncbi:OmpA family protein [Oceanobacter sp. 5_MG-2023]|uniref:OmpA family protein n=1 Tax=Oceanobacter sp. 5_MG-2023 TaxID=3062645 RepID=UPI0026E487BA|nr:OmpA family protein [Oceanobacter sp. 5_MG-2023]MDO6681480.1 OmpA family protein [Oceanobacter sp. 5_MG-2023]